MKIIRWLLNHSLFILLIVAVIYGYMFWGNLLGEDTPAGKAVAYLSDEFVEVKEFVNAVKAKQQQLSEEQLSAQPLSRSKMADVANTNDNDKAPQQRESTEKESTETESIAIEEVAGKPPVEPQPEIEQAVIEQPMIEQPMIEQPMIEQQRVNIAYSQNERPVKQSFAGIIDSTDDVKQVNDPAFAASQDSNSVNKRQPAFDEKDKAGAMAVMHSYTGETFVPAEVEKQLNNVDDNGEVIDASQPSGAVRDNWITARKSFYQRNYELSEQSYQQVIDNTKNNYDAYGELGNVYFNQGKNRQAASAYFEAAAIFVRKGQSNRARSLIGLLRHLDKSKADELQQLIDSTKS